MKYVGFITGHDSTTFNKDDKRFYLNEGSGVELSTVGGDVHALDGEPEWVTE